MSWGQPSPKSLPAPAKRFRGPAQAASAKKTGPKMPTTSPKIHTHVLTLPPGSNVSLSLVHISRGQLTSHFAFRGISHVNVLAPVVCCVGRAGPGRRRRRTGPLSDESPTSSPTLVSHQAVKQETVIIFPRRTYVPMCSSFERERCCYGCLVVIAEKCILMASTAIWAGGGKGGGGPGKQKREPTAVYGPL